VAHHIWQRIKSELHLWRVAAFPGVMVIAVVLALRTTGMLQFLELATLDNLLRSRPPEPPDDRILIVGINEQDIQTLGKYPIPDREIAALIKQLQIDNPVAIGLDIFRDLPVEPGHAELNQLFRSQPNLIAIEKALATEATGFAVAAPPGMPADRVGFADALPDADGYLRRSLLGTHNAKGEFRFSLSIRLAERYLATKGIPLDNGVRDQYAMRFGAAELPRVQSHTGSYIDVDTGGIQTLLNFRSSRQPFRIVSLTTVKARQVPPEWIRDRIVLIGITALSVKDVVNSAAVHSQNPGLVNGVEVQAHAISQIISAALDQRSLLQDWSDQWEYLWIIAWGLVGIGVGRLARSTWKSLLLLSGISLGFVALCYALLIFGWWVPLLPALFVLIFNGAGPTAVLFYRHEQDLRFRLRERQFTLEHTFNTIHNGPLQTLARMLKAAEAENLPVPFQADLRSLNQELRAVYESVRRETLDEGETLHLGSKLDLNLQAPLHEILYEVYSNTLEREFPGFKTIKVHVVKFEPIDSRRLSLEQKRGLCRFLEEALCNVGKYAIGATRLDVTCSQIGKQQVIRVADNGSGPSQAATPQTGSGYGTRQAKNLARQLRGNFRRFPNQPQGMVCELTWSATRFWLW
jgi:CHASE2 domain-containing sensor protein